MFLKTRRRKMMSLSLVVQLQRMRTTFSNVDIWLLVLLHFSQRKEENSLEVSKVGGRNFLKKHSCAWD